jgi:cytochrome P450
MTLALACIALVGGVLLVVVAVMRWYLSPDIGVLSRLQSGLYSLSEVVQAELSACRGTAGNDRGQQILRVRGQQARVYDEFAAEFLRSETAREHHAPANTSRPLFLPLLSRPNKVFVLSDLDLAKWVLNDAATFDRSQTLESFADAFQLDSVFTTKDAGLYRDLRSFFAHSTNGLSSDQYETMMATFQRRVDSMLSTFARSAGVPFIPKVEGMVLEAYADAFFGMRTFPNADECAILIKRIWQIKSLRNNIPSRRWNPLLRLRMRRQQSRLFRIIEEAQALVNDADSSVADEMAQVYIANGHGPGNLLNALIPLYEAISRGVVYALLELASSQSVQEELREEIARHSDDELEYCKSTNTLLHRVWKETLRLRPPTPNQTRRVTTGHNALFPIGSKVVIVWSVFHLDPDVWGPDATEFRPQRWIGVTVEQEQNYHPFGMGVQECVAQNYGSFGGRVMLKRIVESTSIQHKGDGPTTGRVGTDRGYSRGPDPDASILRFVPDARHRRIQR